MGEAPRDCLTRGALSSRRIISLFDHWERQRAEFRKVSCLLSAPNKYPAYFLVAPHGDRGRGPGELWVLSFSGKYRAAGLTRHRLAPRQRIRTQDYKLKFIIPFWGKHTEQTGEAPIHPVSFHSQRYRLIRWRRGDNLKNFDFTPMQTGRIILK